MVKARALVLLSGGLDSKLAVKILQEQGIDVVALHFDLPFGEGCCKAMCSFKFSQLEGINLKIIDCKQGKYFNEYMEVIKKPDYGYGSAANPCIDCRIFMLKIAKKLLKEFKADFIATGEVLNERPMSQYKSAMMLIEKKAGLEGKILRPLSAKLLPETEAEKKGLVNRNNLLSIQGRRRIPQIELAKKYQMSYPNPGGGCLLCERDFAKKLKDFFENNERITEEDLKLLKIGRHFKFNNQKIILGRNQNENAILAKAKGIKLELADGLPGPTGLIFSEDKEIVEKAAQLVVFYAKTSAQVMYGKAKFNKSISVKPIEQKEVESLKI